jgi:PAS domain S-box-containing protein
LNILRAVADSTVNTKTAKEALALILETLKDFELDLPFMLLYSMAANGKVANLEGSLGVEKDSPLAPATINLEQRSFKTWPFSEVLQKGKPVQVEELGKIFGTFTCGPYLNPPEQALVFPVTLHGTAHNFFLVAGVSSRRNLDKKYRLFYELLSESVTNALTKARAYEEERKKAEALAEIDKAKTLFFSNISHEFRTPLTLILGSLEELLSKRSGEIAPTDKGSLETSHRNAMRLLKLVNNLLDFSRLEAGRVQAHYQLTDIARYTTELASNFRSVVEAAGLKFLVKTDAVIHAVYIDKEMWEKIVLNLLSNAFKYTLKGSITLSLTTGNGQVVLKVADTGIGIPEAELPKMFQRFHRVQNVVGRTYEGTGIGLSLVSELVKLHGGEIGVQSKERAGSVFTVSIPTGKSHLPIQHVSEKELEFTASLSDAFVEEATTLVGHSAPVGNETETLQRMAGVATVLVVDDNDDMRGYITNILQKQYHVVTASNGMDALHQLKEHAPQLIVSDIMMPVMDGIGLLRAVKENTHTQNLPVILLSARAGEESKIEGYQTGADDYLVKPFSAKELLARVSSQLKLVKLRHATETNVRNLFMQAPALIAVLGGPQHIYELANAMYMQLVGNRDIVGKPFRETLPELEGVRYLEILDKVYKSGEPFVGNELPATIQRTNGKLEEGFFNFIYQASYDSEGEISGIIVYGVEVTEQIIARRRLEESEGYLQDIFYQAPAAIAVLEGASHKYVLANSLYQKMISRSEKQLLGKTVEEVFPELETSGVFQIFDDVYKTGEPFVAPEFEVMIDRFNDGLPHTGYYNFTLKPMKTGEKISSLMVVAYDITEQMEARKKIADSEKRYHSLIQSSPSPIGILRGEDHVITIANDAIIEMWGKGKDIFGKNFFEVMPELAEQGFKEVFATVYATGVPFSAVETPVTILQDGRRQLRYYNSLLFPQKDVNGTIDGIGIIANEVTLQALTNKQIKESEEHLRALVNATSNVIYRMNADWSEMRALQGRGFLSDTGEPIRNWVQKYIYPDDQQRVRDAISVAMRTKNVFELEHQVVQADGSLGWTFSRAVPILDSNGEVLEWFGAASNTTERNRITESLKKSEEHLELLSNTVPAMIFYLDAEQKYLSYNQTFMQWFGISSKEAIGKTVREFMGEEAYKSLLPHLSIAYAGEQERFEMPAPAKLGEGAWLSIVYTPHKNEKGEVLGIIVHATDITRSKQTEAELREGESRFRNLADNSPMFVFIIEPGAEATISYWNRTWLDYTGQTFDGALGRAWNGIIHPDDVPSVIDIYGLAFEKKQPYYIPAVRTKRHDGEYRWYMYKASPRYLPNGEFNGYIGVGFDVNEQQMIKEKLEALVNERTKKLQRSNEDLQQFAHVASHDLKEPVRKIRTFGNRLTHEFGADLPDKAKVYVAKMESAATRLSAMIDGVLIYSSLDGEAVEYEVVDLNETIRNIKEDLELLIAQKDAIIRYQDLPSIEGSSLLIYQLFYNLIYNSLKFSKNNISPVLEIKSEAAYTTDLLRYNLERIEDDYVKISIIDNGIGFGADAAEKIFKTFSRLHSKDLYEGTGLGLALCKKIVERHGEPFLQKGRKTRVQPLKYFYLQSTGKNSNLYFNNILWKEYFY